MNLRNVYRIPASAAVDFLFYDDALTLGASLGFYTAVSLAPLLLILLALTALLGPQVQTQIVQEVQNSMGPRAGTVIGEIVARGHRQQAGGEISAAVGFALLLFFATGVFAQMQYALNRIWGVQPKPGHGLWQWVRQRLLSLGMMLALGFLLLVSLSVSTAIQVIFAGTSGLVWRVVNGVASVFVYTLLFALIYKILPDVQISWRDTAGGALLTGVLFAAGRFLLGLYLARNSLTSPYGSAGSLVVLLLWIYYASLIFFFGAELTQTWMAFHGRPLQPYAFAEETPEGQQKRRRQRQAAAR